MLMTGGRVESVVFSMIGIAGVFIYVAGAK